MPVFNTKLPGFEKAVVVRFHLFVAKCQGRIPSYQLILYFHLMKNSKAIIPIAAAVAGTLIFTAFGVPSMPVQQPSFSDKYWVMESSTIVPAADMNGDGKPDADLRDILEDCDKDDAEMFRSDGKLMTHHGTKKCDSDEEEITEMGTWKYDPATKQITTNQDGMAKPHVVTIKELTASKMVATFDFTSTDGQKHTVTGTYKVK